MLQLILQIKELGLILIVYGDDNICHGKNNLCQIQRVFWFGQMLSYSILKWGNENTFGVLNYHRLSNWIYFLNSHRVVSD